MSIPKAAISSGVKASSDTVIVSSASNLRDAAVYCAKVNVAVATRMVSTLLSPPSVSI